MNTSLIIKLIFREHNIPDVAAEVIGLVLLLRSEINDNLEVRYLEWLVNFDRSFGKFSPVEKGIAMRIIWTKYPIANTIKKHKEERREIERLQSIRRTKQTIESLWEVSRNHKNEIPEDCLWLLKCKNIRGVESCSIEMKLGGKDYYLGHVNFQQIKL